MTGGQFLATTRCFSTSSASSELLGEKIGLLDALRARCFKHICGEFDTAYVVTSSLFSNWLN